MNISRNRRANILIWGDLPQSFEVETPAPAKESEAIPPAVESNQDAIERFFESTSARCRNARPLTVFRR